MCKFFYNGGHPYIFPRFTMTQNSCSHFIGKERKRSNLGGGPFPCPKYPSCLTSILHYSGSTCVLCLNNRVPVGLWGVSLTWYGWINNRRNTIESGGDDHDRRPSLSTFLDTLIYCSKRFLSPCSSPISYCGQWFYLWWKYLPLSFLPVSASILIRYIHKIGTVISPFREGRSVYTSGSSIRNNWR